MSSDDAAALGILVTALAAGFFSSLAWSALALGDPQRARFRAQDGCLLDGWMAELLETPRHAFSILTALRYLFSAIALTSFIYRVASDGVVEWAPLAAGMLGPPCPVQGHTPSGLPDHSLDIAQHAGPSYSSLGPPAGAHQ